MPAFDPPFDDEMSPEVWATAHQLAFDWGAPPGPDQHRAQRDRSTADHGAGADGADAHRAGSFGTAGNGTGGRCAGDHGAEAQGTGSPSTGGRDGSGQSNGGQTGNGAAGQPAGAGASVAGASVEAKLAVRRFVAVCVEVLNGYRPAAHLRRLSLPSEAAGVVAQAIAGTRRVAEMRRATGRQVRSTSRHGRRPDPVAVHKLRLCEPRVGAVEAAVLLITGDRTWALALRLEQHQQSWAATTLRMI